MTFKELALKMLKRFPDGIWVHFHDMPDRFRIRNEIYLDEQSLDEFESRLKKEVADYYVDSKGNTYEHNEYGFSEIPPSRP